MHKFPGPALFVLSLLLLISACGEEPKEGVKQESQATLARKVPDPGGVERRQVESTGRGPTVPEAIDEAIRIAIEQVNGKSMEVASTRFQAAAVLTVNNKSIDIHSSGFAQAVNSFTKGAVSDFKIISVEDMGGQGFKVSIEASIAKYRRGENANRVTLAIAPLRVAAAVVVDGKSVSGEAIAVSIRQKALNALTQTKRFAVLDRDFAQEVDRELSEISSGKVPTDDLARIGQQLAADYVLVGQLDRFEYLRHERRMRSSERTVVSHSGGASLTLRLVNVATRQIELSETFDIKLPQTEPTTLGASVDAGKIIDELSGKLVDGLTQTVVNRLFPVTVVAMNGDEVVLSQGGRSLNEGARYEIIVRGDEVRDPQTGDVLGRVERQCCVVEIVRVTPELSYGSLVSKGIDVSSAFAPGALEVRNQVVVAASKSTAPRATKVMPGKSVDAPVKTGSSQNSDPADDKDENW